MKAKIKKNTIIKRVVDAVLTALLLFLMAYQVTGDVIHEWLGIGMTLLLIVHHLLNRKWYGSVFKGKYNPYRIVMTSVNTLLFVSIALTAITGMAMSGHAVPFLYGFIGMMTARSLHLAMSYWSFIFMGIHIGLHIKTAVAKLKGKQLLVFRISFTAVSGVGCWLLLKSGIVNYIFFKSHFAFLDYTKAKWLVIIENLAMLIFCAFVGFTSAELSQKRRLTKTNQNNGIEEK